MAKTLPRILLAALGGLALIAVSACAPADSPGGTAPDVPIAAPGQVVAQGVVMQTGGGEPEFCLGAIRESYPPQCDGVPLAGWDWSKVEGSETASGTTWGSYVIWGTWDGITYTVVGDPMMLALYDPIPVPDPRQWDAEAAGDNTDAELERVQDDILRTKDFDMLFAGPANGYLFVTVVYDNGDVQRYVDDRYGSDVVEIRSAITPVPGS